MLTRGVSTRPVEPCLSPRQTGAGACQCLVAAIDLLLAALEQVGNRKLKPLGPSVEPAFALVQGALPEVEMLLPLIRDRLALVSEAFSLVRDPLAFAGKPVPFPRGGEQRTDALLLASVALGVDLGLFGCRGRSSTHDINDRLAQASVRYGSVKPVPSASPGSRTNWCSPVRWAVPSTSVSTPSSVVPTMRALKVVPTIES